MTDEQLKAIDAALDQYEGSYAGFWVQDTVRPLLAEVRRLRAVIEDAQRHRNDCPKCGDCTEEIALTLERI